MRERPWLIRQVTPFIYDQTTPMNEVIIVHNKGKLYPPVTLIGEDGQPFEALIESIDKNSVSVKLNLAVIFTAYIY